MDSPNSPLTLIRGVVDSRLAQDIELSGYREALKVLLRHFDVYEQRLQVMQAPASFQDGEVMIEAANEGLNQLRRAVEELGRLDPVQATDEASLCVEEAARGFDLLMQLQEVTQEKIQQFEEAVREYEESGGSDEYTSY